MTTIATALRQRRARRTSWWKTATGLALTAIMLFPVYWMLNASFTPDQDMRKSPPDLFPVHGTLEVTGPSWTTSCPTSAPASSSAWARSS